MKRETVRVYCYKTKCIDCSKDLKVYYTVSDFGDAPILMRCKNCNEHYWYTLDDEYHVKPINQQLEGLKCEKCGLNLKEYLVHTHEDIKCCGNEFSLDDDFADNKIPPENEMVYLEVYMIYS